MAIWFQGWETLDFSICVDSIRERWKVKVLLYFIFSLVDIPTLIAGCLLGFLIGMALMRIVAITEQKHIRKTAVRGSKNQILGELYEKILPALPDFPYAPKDMLFVWKGCDYIIFDGLSEGRLREIIFLELKSGNARLTQNEAAIKYILDHKKVRFTEYRIDSIRNKE